MLLFFSASFAKKAEYAAGTETDGIYFANIFRLLGFLSVFRKKTQIKFRFKFPGLFFQARPGCGLFCAFLINPIKEGCPPESGIRAFTKTCPVCKI